MLQHWEAFLCGVISLEYEGISSFLHHKRHKALHKAVKVIEKRTDMQCNRVYHLEDIMIMYGTNNSDTLMDLIETVHKMHNITKLREKDIYRNNAQMA